MGIAGKLGFSIGGLVALGALIYIFKDKLAAGAQTVGGAIGETIGGGIGSIGPSLVESFTRQASDIFSGGRAVGDNQTSFFGGGGISKSEGIANPYDVANFGKNGVADYDYVSQGPDGTIRYYKKGALIGTVDSQTINQANRDYSDQPNLLPSAAGLISFGASQNIPFFAKPRPNTTVKSVTTSGGSISSVTRTISAAQQKAAISSASPARQAAVAKAKARASAKKKGKKCFNTGLEMGGVEHIDYRIDTGVF